jgi:hypothetical protein
MLNVNGIKRNAKNIVKKYSDAQVKVREATSNDPWGPSSTIMSEIADLTYNVVAFSEIMQMIWKRLNDHGKNWRHVYKALVLLEYLIKTGNEKVAQQCIENIFAIQTLKDFQFMEDNKDYGLNIREKSKKLVALLKDSDKLKAERARALKAKARLAESMSSVSKNSLGLMMRSSVDGETPISSTTNANGFFQNGTGSSPSTNLGDVSGSTISPDLDSARPQTATEEENQLKLALALSKEEAEQQEKTRKNDELRLKLALDVSKKSAITSNSSNLIDDSNEPSTSSGSVTQPSEINNTVVSSTTPATQSQSKSAIDDLLGLSIPAPNEAFPAVSSSSSSALNNVTTNPSTFLSPLMSSTSSSFNTASPISSVFPEPSNDPWSADLWKTTSNPSALLSTNMLSATTSQQAPVNLLQGITPNTLTSTTNTTMPVVGSSSGATGSNGLFTSGGTRRPMSKNPFQD